MAEALQIVCAVSLVLAAFLVSMPLGFAVFGVMTGAAGLVAESAKRRRTRGTSQPPP